MRARLSILRTQSDERLLELARSGSDAAFEAIVQRYRRQLVRYCARVLGDADAEEAVQEALIKAHGALARGAVVRKLGPWLHAVAHNAALNILRRRLARRECQQNGCEQHELAVEFPDLQRENFRAFLNAVRSLPERQRDAIVMRELEGRSYDEIAVRLGA